MGYLEPLGRVFAELELEFGPEAFCTKPDQTYKVLFDDAAELLGRKISCVQGDRPPGEVGYSIAWVCMGLDFGDVNCGDFTAEELRSVSTCYRPFSFSPISFGIDGAIDLDVVRLIAPCLDDVTAYAFQSICRPLGPK